MGKNQVVVAMSGGVDSSVAAALLVQQGYDVIGMMLRLWSEPGKECENRCCTPDAILQAKNVASLLNIPFYVIDAQKSFYNIVVQYFLQSYIAGTTPNPCLVCNREIRWGLLLDHAMATGYDFMATGHYVRLEQDANGYFLLKRGIDKAKDQSYVLHGLNQTQLSRSLFPLANYTKPEVRQLAQDFNFPVAEREESQDLCFLENEDYRDFINRHISTQINPGVIINTQGKVLGQHSGLPYYTIGQRKGLGIYSPTPYYVIKKDIKNNILIVGENEQRLSKDLYVTQMNWISGSPPNDVFNAEVMIRYRTKPKRCTVHVIEPERVYIDFDQSVYDVTPGQAAVVYNGEICLGGGIIQ